ncbi:hypothetical protein Y1Q_0015526 [Alligator mississippiensis]|uniref:Uncharacterized protein n=1 Tax=Alligator mississippiensis TaxID=8496 RepID=A0A151NNG1_ALLMI|nr:hypothetical protein Y1Q_0015526 [Alligator mississippiensis]
MSRKYQQQTWIILNSANETLAHSREDYQARIFVGDILHWTNCMRELDLDRFLGSTERLTKALSRKTSVS